MTGLKAGSGGFRGSIVEELAIGIPAGDATLLGSELEGFFAVELGQVDQFFDARGDRLGCVGVCAGHSGFGRADEQGHLAFGGPIAQGLHKIEEFAAPEFFVNFGDLAGQAGRAIAEDGQSVGDGVRDAVGRFVENHGALFDAETLESAAAFATARG